MQRRDTDRCVAFRDDPEVMKVSTEARLEHDFKEELEYAIANPKAFFENPDIAKFHGFDPAQYSGNTALTELAVALPVIYIGNSIYLMLIPNVNITYYKYLIESSRYTSRVWHSRIRVK